MKRIIVLFSVLALFACQQKPANENNTTAKVIDPHSFSEPEKVVVKHLDLDLRVDFSTNTLTGKAIWTIENPSKHDELVLDTRQLNIQKVTLDGDTEETMFAVGDEEKYVGQPLSINIKPETNKVTIWYTTSRDAAALQWLTPQQTAGKKSPFLFTQSQAILARTWIPCQDSPGIRFTYNARVTVPKELMALMSAENPKEKNSTGVYKFKQPKAIPAYLMALAVGDIAFKAIDNRTAIYAEPVTLEKAIWEFADMGKMVNAAEKLYGSYQWGRYDVLVLPPSFPFGGMENPMLTFATPTVIAGDRSLVSLIAHELAHSWSGNLVTNATWNDFWLNEGFTTYFERRIIEAVYSKEEAKMQEVLGRQDLDRIVTEFGKKSADTRLKLDLNKRDPDEGMNDIAYEKGYFFLRTIEEAVGRDKFDALLKDYFNNHTFQSVTTENFLNYLNEHLIKNDESLKKKINVGAWVYQPGIPSNIPSVGSKSFEKIDSLVKKVENSNVTGLSQQIKSTNEKLYFISHLPAKISNEQMLAIDKEFGFTNSGNSEIQAAWYTLAVQNDYRIAFPQIEKFLITVGRRKFLMPLYKEMVKSSSGKQMAKAIYTKARPNYHSVAVNSIDKLLK